MGPAHSVSAVVSAQMQYLTLVARPRLQKPCGALVMALSGLRGERRLLHELGAQSMTDRLCERLFKRIWERVSVRAARSGAGSGGLRREARRSESLTPIAFHAGASPNIRAIRPQPLIIRSFDAAFVQRMLLRLCDDSLRDDR